MNGTTEVKDIDRVYLDTNILIEIFETRSTLGEKLASLLMTEPPINPQPFVVSELALTEWLVKPLQLKRNDLIQLYENWMITNSYLEVVPVIREILRDAAELRSRDGNLKLPDAIHLTTAVGTRCRYFLTNDKRIAGQFGVEILRLTEESVRRLTDARAR
ncbi:MAG: type II toxin-antitoxin system VapC family toxin [Pseudorhodoplanes sp.]